MAYIKISPSMFLGLQELESLKDTIDKDGFRKLLIESSSSFGFIKNSNVDLSFSNGKVQEGTNAGTIKINPIFAIDSDGLFIRDELIDNVAITSSATQWYWIKVSHGYNPVEKGTVSVSVSGVLSGTNTSFTKKLRGQPNFPSKIRFVGSANNTQEYEVLSVLDDNNVLLQGNFTAESNLKYVVVGTFAPGVPVAALDKDPFQYDNSVIEIVPEGATLNEAPVKLSGKEFWLARVRNNAGVMLIEDKRTEIWNSIHSWELIKITLQNKFIGVESVRYDSEYTNKENSLIQIGWGLRTSNHTMSASLRQITISNGIGGVFKNNAITAPFTNGDFNGWRLYFKNGKYSRIVESVIDAGAIKVTLDELNPDNYSAADELHIVPDVEEVIIKLSNDDALDTNRLLTKELAFPVNTAKCLIRVLMPSNTFYMYNVVYRHKNNNIYSQFLPLPNGSYYTEVSYNADGTLKSDPATHVTYSYTGHATNGYIRLEADPKSYFTTLNRIDKGDKFGVRFREMSNTSPLIGLTVGADEFYQKIQNNGKLVMSTNQIISLRTEGAKAGNEFFCFIQGPFDTSGGTYTIEFREDYVSAGDPGILKHTIDDGSLHNGNIIVFCAYQGQGSPNGWVVNRINSGAGSEDVGEIKMYSGPLTERFDSTGLGISSRWFGWALANGQNGTVDLRKKFITGYDPGNVDYAMGAIGGTEKVFLQVAEMPEHRHFIANTGDSPDPNLDATNSLVKKRSSGGEFSAHLGGLNIEPTIGFSSKTGANQSHENRPPYYALAFVQKILNV